MEAVIACHCEKRSAVAINGHSGENTDPESHSTVLRAGKFRMTMGGLRIYFGREIGWWLLTGAPACSRANPPSNSPSVAGRAKVALGQRAISTGHTRAREGGMRPRKKNKKRPRKQSCCCFRGQIQIFVVLDSQGVFESCLQYALRNCSYYLSDRRTALEYQQCRDAAHTVLC